MIAEISIPKMPQWLATTDALTINSNPFPLKEILTDSLYYPSSAFDGNPVRFLAGNFYSYIYVDYGLTEEQLNTEINNRGFIGYEITARRELTEKDLAPSGWKPVPPLPEDGDPRSREWFVQKPFAQWIVFQRKQDFTDDHGPERFSLVYLCADGTAAFQALYISNNIAPKAVAIIQSGIAFGGNYTDFRIQNLLLGRTVLQNPAGMPEYLLNGTWDCSPECACWTQYDKLIWQHKTPHGGVFLFGMEKPS